MLDAIVTPMATCAATVNPPGTSGSPSRSRLAAAVPTIAPVIAPAGRPSRSPATPPASADEASSAKSAAEDRRTSGVVGGSTLTRPGAQRPSSPVRDLQIAGAATSAVSSRTVWSRVTVATSAPRDIARRAISAIPPVVDPMKAVRGERSVAAYRKAPPPRESISMLADTTRAGTGSSRRSRAELLSTLDPASAPITMLLHRETHTRSTSG